MDPKLFIKSLPGSLVPIPRDPGTGNEHAFIPRPLPPNWEFPDRLWPLLVDAKYQLGILEGLGRTLPNPTILLRPLEDRDAIKSSRLEGTYVTATELLVFEMQAQESKSEDDPTNHSGRSSTIAKRYNRGRPPSFPFPTVHKGSSPYANVGRPRQGSYAGGIPSHAGGYWNGPPLRSPPPDKLLECLDPLEKYFHVEKSRYDPLVDCFLITLPI